MIDRIRLLHIEDDENYRDLMEATLRIEPLLNFDLASAATLAEGANRLKQTVFDIVLLDWTLPDAEGGESIATLRAIDPNISILVFTAHDEPEIVEAARVSGAEGFLIKGSSNLKTIITTLHFAASQRKRRDNRIVTALERMLGLLENAT